MKKIMIVILFLMIYGSCFANPLQFAWQTETKDDQWILADTLIQSLFISLMIIDWKQTDRLMRIKESITYEEEIYDENEIYIGYKEKTYTQYKYKEKNPILGEHPSRKRLAVYMGTCIISHTLIAYILPRPWREIWQAFGIGIEIYAVSSNYATEVKWGFEF